jgi:alpha-beta hydrolase superfamily lysophospholipase
MSSAHPRPVYLATEPDPILAWLHPSLTGSSPAVAVLLLGPFGWEDVASYRGRREWACELAAAGYPTARLDLPGAGDSAGSSRGPARLDAWTDAVGAAAGWLRGATGAGRLAAIGVGLGGLVACRAAANGAVVDDLALWAVPARGHTLLRELRAFAAVAAAQFPDPRASAPPSGPEPDGALDVAGYVLAPDTIAALEALDLTELSIPEPVTRRVLLFGRDGRAPDRRLREHFEQLGSEVTVADGSGFQELVASPEQSRMPTAVIEETRAWLAGAPPGGWPGGAAAAPPVGELDQLVLGAVKERVLEFELGPGVLVGVSCEPVERPVATVCAVLLNAGAVRHTGPNRAWVELARRWAANGVPSLRIDLDGIGDSDGDGRVYEDIYALHTDVLLQRTRSILDELAARGWPGRFVLVGLCSGAYYAARAALEDDRVAAAFAINLYTFDWDPALVAERELRRTRALAREGGIGWLGLRTLRPGRAWRLLRSLRIGRGSGGTAGHVEPDLDRLRDRGGQMLALLGRGEPTLADFSPGGELYHPGRWPNITIAQIPSRDHTFRALELQRHVHTELDRALGRVLEPTVPGAGRALASKL